MIIQQHGTLYNGLYGVYDLLLIKKMRKQILKLFTLCLLCFCLMLSTAAGHESIGSVSNVIITVQGQTINYYLNIPPALFSLMDEMLAAGDPVMLREYFSMTLTMSTWDVPCELNKMYPIAPQSSGNRIIHAIYQCQKEVKDLTITSNLFFDIDDKHMQFIKLAPPQNPRQVLKEGILTLGKQVFHIADVKTGGSVLMQRAYRFFILGIEHILTGYDHILFILSAILVAVRFIETLKMVTSFTVAHSITLILAFSGIISLPSRIVEPFIAFTIVYVAFENVFMKNFSRRWMITSVFGLIHGLGFVGVLKEITVSRQELLTSLFSFNIGIEAGQLLIVGTCVLFLYYIRNRSWRPILIRWLSICIGILGLVWFFERALAVDLIRIF